MLTEQLASLIREYDKSHERLFQTVALSAELESALTARKVRNGCYVIPHSKRAENDNFVNLAITERFQILLITSSTNGRETVLTKMQDVVFSALLAKELKAGTHKTTPCLYKGGELIDFVDGTYLWTEFYEVTYFTKLNKDRK